MVARNEADGEVLSVNVGAVREFEYNGRIVKSGIWKFPVSGRVMVKGVNLDGDDQADRSVHGGPDKAVYVYAVEDQRWWQGEIDRALQYGEVGENLTTRGIDVSGALVGERWRIGSCLFEVSEPRFPCWKLGARMGDPRFPKRFAEAGRPGTYLRVIQEGDVGAGDEIRVVSRPDHDVSIGDVFRNDKPWPLRRAQTAFETLPTMGERFAPSHSKCEC
jgi:MOSC domain-containing protein YiiM